MAENKLSLEELYAQQAKVAEAERVEKDILSKQSAERQRQSISQQLAKQRQDYLATRQQVSQQGYLRGKTLASQLSSRGLGYGGIQQLSQLQNKIVEGQSLSDLARTNRDVVEAGLQAGTQTEQSLQNALRQSSIDYQKSIAGGLAAREATEYERNQTAENLRLQLGQTLLEAQMSGATEEQLQNLKSLYAGVGGTQEEFDTLLNDLMPIVDPATGELTYNSRASWGKTGALTASMAAGAGIGTLIAPGLGTAIGAVGGGLAGIIGNEIAGDKGKLIYTLPGIGKQSFNSPQEASSAIMNIYKDREYGNAIKVDINDKGKVAFVSPDNRKFDTYNKAETWAKSQNLSTSTISSTPPPKKDGVVDSWVSESSSFRGR